MGLFDNVFEKKVCCICGKKAGLIGRQKIADDGYICGKCFTQCSGEITAERYEELTKEDIRAHLTLLDEDRAFYADEFCETDRVEKGLLSAKTVLSVDRDNGYWCAPCSHNGFVYDFSQIRDFWLDLQTRYLTEDERRERGPRGMFGPGYDFGFFHRSPAHGMPMCPPDHEITAMNVYIEVDHDYADVVKIPVMDALIVTDSDIRDGYRAAHEIFDLLNRCIEESEEAADEEESVASGAADAAEAIKKFKELLDIGAIMQEEFDAKKKQLLGL